MPRRSLDLPPVVHFSIDIPVRISDINYGGHLGNDAVLSIVHEARLRFLKELSCSEIDCAGAGLIMADASIVFRAEAFHGDVLSAEVWAGEVSGAGFQIYTRLIHRDTRIEIARVRTGMVCFDYRRKRPVPVPATFTNMLARLPHLTPTGDSHTQGHRP